MVIHHVDAATSKAKVGLARDHAFDDFVVARSPALLRTAFLLTGDVHTAEDLVQTALVKSWPHLHRVESFEAYVRRVLINTYRAWWRRRWRNELPDDSVGLEVPSIDQPSDPDLRAALAVLPRSQRAVIVLRYYDGLTEQQTADLLGVALGTVKSHHARAIKTLRVSTELASHAEEML